MVTVAMIAMMRNNPTRKTLLKVTMSMVTTVTTVLHRDLENDWSSFFSTANLLVFRALLDLYGDAASTWIGLYDRALGLWSHALGVITYFFFSNAGLSHSSHDDLRVPLFVHAPVILLLLMVGAHDCSAIVLLRGIKVISCSFGFLRSCRFSVASTTFGFSSMLNRERQGRT